MNKSMMYTALILFCAASYAENDPTQTNPTAKPNANNTLPATVIQTAPVSSPSMNQPAPIIDCKYHIQATTTNIDQNIVMEWAKKAAVQSFAFNPTTIDTELGVLKECYTEQGWQGFNDALQKSGNITAIKDQHLTVSGQVNGLVIINSAKDNQWKVQLPMQVVYQNDKEKLTQILNIELLIGRKISGDLGIMQLIATPKPANNPASSNPAMPQTKEQSPTTGTKP